MQFWSVVKIVAGESSFAFKCLHERQGATHLLACFSPVEIPLFEITIDGHGVKTVASSPVVAEKIPFDIGRIGRDVWRVHVALTDADLVAYDGLNDPDLPEDRILVETDDHGVVVSKTFLAGETVVAAVSFSDWAGEGKAARAGRIVFESIDPPYTIEVVQGHPIE